MSIMGPLIPLVPLSGKHPTPDLALEALRKYCFQHQGNPSPCYYHPCTLRAAGTRTGEHLPTGPEMSIYTCQCSDIWCQGFFLNRDDDLKLDLSDAVWQKF